MVSKVVLKISMEIMHILMTLSMFNLFDPCKAFFPPWSTVQKGCVTLDKTSFILTFAKTVMQYHSKLYIFLNDIHYNILTQMMVTQLFS